jgi:hypothetical protein
VVAIWSPPLKTTLIGDMTARIQRFVKSFWC